MWLPLIRLSGCRCSRHIDLANRMHVCHDDPGWRLVLNGFLWGACSFFGYFAAEGPTATPSYLQALFSYIHCRLFTLSGETCASIC